MNFRGCQYVESCSAARKNPCKQRGREIGPALFTFEHRKLLVLTKDFGRRNCVLIPTTAHDQYAEINIQYSSSNIEDIAAVIIARRLKRSKQPIAESAELSWKTVYNELLATCAFASPARSCEKTRETSPFLRVYARGRLARSSHGSRGIDLAIDRRHRDFTVTPPRLSIEHARCTYSIERFELHVVERGHIHHGALEQNGGSLAGHSRDCVSRSSRGTDQLLFDYRSRH